MSLYKNEDEHQRFLRKNAMMARGIIENKKKDEEKQTNEIVKKADSCYNCRKKVRCVEFKNMTTGGLAGAVSIDASVKFICDRFDVMPIQKKNMHLSSNQVSNLLKRAKTGKL